MILELTAEEKEFILKLLIYAKLSAQAGSFSRMGAIENIKIIDEISQKLKTHQCEIRSSSCHTEWSDKS